MLLTGFIYTKIVIIQSLEGHEFQTGTELWKHASAKAVNAGINLPIEIINCAHFNEFRGAIERLIDEATACGEIPLVHVECHGGNDGLEFANGSTLSYEDIAALLVRLNIACRFNLLVFFSACFGAYFIGQMGAIAKCPCYCIIAPTETIYPDEIYRGSRLFYDVLLESMDAGRAVDALTKLNLTRGRWLGFPAELWFEKLLIGYAEKWCTEKAMRKRARIMFRQMIREEGVRKGIGSILRHIKKQTPDLLCEKYFRTYFLVDKIPENEIRFSATRARVEWRLNNLRNKGYYV